VNPNDRRGNSIRLLVAAVALAAWLGLVALSVTAAAVVGIAVIGVGILLFARQWRASRRGVRSLAGFLLVLVVVSSLIAEGDMRSKSSPLLAIVSYGGALGLSVVYYKRRR
jgi:hypothetical protein